MGADDAQPTRADAVAEVAAKGSSRKLSLTTSTALVLGGVLLGAAIGVPVGPILIAQAQAQPAVTEDDPGWDCRVQGDRVCGPTNDQGMPAGLYSNGSLVAAWEPAWFGHPELVPAL